LEVFDFVQEKCFQVTDEAAEAEEGEEAEEPRTLNKTKRNPIHEHFFLLISLSLSVWNKQI
jgi:hypothetical protein